VQASLLRRCCDIAAGLSYLHQRNVCHGDLKLDNVLLRRVSMLLCDSCSFQTPASLPTRPHLVPTLCLHPLHTPHSTTEPQDPDGLMAAVADFGLSRALAFGQSHLSTRRYGTVTHMPPELLVRHAGGWALQPVCASRRQHSLGLAWCGPEGHRH
jgi:serine/threonine protein kinase